MSDIDNGQLEPLSDKRGLTTLLYSRVLARVLSCVFDFGAMVPVTYIESVTLRSARMKSALTIWLIWPDLLVRFGVVSSRSCRVSLRNAGFHIDRQREEDLASFYSSAGIDDGSSGSRIGASRTKPFTGSTFNPTAEHH